MIKLTTGQWDEIERARRERHTSVSVSLSSPMNEGTVAVAFDGVFVGYIRPDGSSTIVGGSSE